jgi:hypothetical protein
MKIAPRPGSPKRETARLRDGVRGSTYETVTDEEDRPFPDRGPTPICRPPGVTPALAKTQPREIRGDAPGDLLALVGLGFGEPSERLQRLRRRVPIPLTDHPRRPINEVQAENDDGMIWTVPEPLPPGVHPDLIPECHEDEQHGLARP